MKRVLILILLTSSIMAYGQESSTNDQVEQTKSFLIKGDIGWGVYPGLTGFLIYGQVPNALDYTSGLTFNGDFLYFLNPKIALGLNSAYIPILHFNESGFSASIEMIPIIGEFQFYPCRFFYLNLGLGMGFLHGSGQTQDSNVHFVDLVSGQDTGQSFNVWRGPYFLISYALGFQIDLSGRDQFGIDIFYRNYMIFGHPGLDQLSDIAEKNAGVPGILLKIIVNTGLGFYFKF